MGTVPVGATVAYGSMAAYTRCTGREPHVEAGRYAPLQGAVAGYCCRALLGVSALCNGYPVTVSAQPRFATVR